MNLRKNWKDLRKLRRKKSDKVNQDPAFWEELLRRANLNMNRGTTIQNPEGKNIEIVYGADAYDKAERRLVHRRIGPRKRPEGRGPQV